ncbi:MAG: tetratricopeptide repeat protein [Atribacterota bacterium]
MKLVLLVTLLCVLMVRISFGEEVNLFDRALEAKYSGDWERALELFEACIAQGEQTLDAFWEAGLLLVERGKYRKAFELSEQAIPVFTLHLAEHPEDHMNWFRLGYTYELRSSTGLLREWEKAKECFVKALEYSPENAFYLLHLGYVLYKMGEREEAEKVFRGILEKHPLDFEVRYWLAVVLEAQGKYKEAKEELLFLKNHAPQGFGRMKEVERLLRRVERKG